MSRVGRRHLRARTSQRRVVEKTRRRRQRKMNAGGVAAATAVALGVSSLAPTSAAATSEDSVELVADLKAVGSGDPTYLTPFAGAVFFALNDGSHGTELWKSDGTAEGTVLVKDIDPGSGGGYPAYLSVAGSQMFFSADDGSGSALWKSDGTPEGTVEVAAIEMRGYQTGAIGDTLFFSAEDATHGRELWQSDGTSAGTAMVKDIAPGSTSYYGDIYPNSSNPFQLTSAGGEVFFTADDGVNGEELWKTDGTTSGTVMVKNIAPDIYYYGPREITAVGDVVFFRANDGVKGRELWRSDGTSGGTFLVKDIFTGSSGGGYPNESEPERLANVNGVLYFGAQSGSGTAEIWRSDGTAAGTVKVKDGFYTHPTFRPDDFTFAGGKVFFTAYDGDVGRELWRTDGTSVGTVLIGDLNPGTYDDGYYTYPNGSNPDELTAVGDRLVFVGDSTVGLELWSSDGTLAGTKVIDVNAGQVGSSPKDLTLTAAGTLLLSAFDDEHGTELRRFVPGDHQVVVPPSNAFSLPKRGKANTKKGTLTIQVALPGAGRLKLGPSGKSPVRVVSKTVSKGTTSLTISLTKAGKKKLKAALAQAIKQGKKVGKLKVVTAVTFTPTGGVPRTVTRKYTLKLK